MIGVKLGIGFGGAKQAISNPKTIGLRFGIKLKKATPHLEPP